MVESNDNDNDNRTNRHRSQLDRRISIIDDHHAVNFTYPDSTPPTADNHDDSSTKVQRCGDSDHRRHSSPHDQQLA